MMSRYRVHKIESIEDIHRHQIKVSTTPGIAKKAELDGRRPKANERSSGKIKFKRKVALHLAPANAQNHFLNPGHA
jgi:hypothetical protein